MPATAKAVTLKAVSLLAAAVAALLFAEPLATWAAGQYRLVGWSEVFDAGTALADRVSANVSAWVVAGYARRPLLMIGLAGVLLLPPLVIAGRMVYRRRPRRALPQHRHHDDQGFPSNAWVEIDGNMRIWLPAGRDFLQIGRERDNDICLEDDSVHRYHAIIERARGLGFTITDIGGPDGNGLSVNGARLATSLLADGDTIELGCSKLRFATAA